MRARTILWLGLSAVLCQSLYAAPLATYTVGADRGGSRYLAEGHIEAQRQSIIAPQVAGQIRQLSVRAGDRIQKGQVLVRLDDSAASQSAAASRAMTGAAAAQRVLAQRDYLRQRQLFADGYISQAAMDRAQAQYQAAHAAASAQASQAGAATAAARFYTLTAPYSGLVASVFALPGDMAMPGQRLLSIYDPSALKVVTNVAQSVLPALRTDSTARIQVGEQSLRPARVTVAPGADPSSHTVEIRLDLATVPTGLVPGTFARVAFLKQGPAPGLNLRVPARAVVIRGELTGVYVLDRAGRPQLRQIRTGAHFASWVEVLSGLSVGETIASDPLAAARMTAGD